MDPARGLAQAVTDLAGLALQQVDLARRGVQVRGLDATALGVAGVDAPLGVELLGVDAGAGAFVRQELRDVEADATRADHGHALAHGLLVAQHVQVAQHLGVVGAVDGGGAGAHAGGQHDLVEAACGELVNAHAGVQLELHAGELDLLAEVAQGLVELFLAGDLLGHVELAADLAGGVEQGHAVAALGGGGGKSQASGAGAHDGDALLGRLNRLDLQDRLVAGTRVDQAGGDLAAEGVVQAGLVAADAGVDLIGPAGGGLVDEVGVGQQRARHRHHVRLTRGQDLLAHFRRVDAVGGDQRQLDLALELFGDPGEGGTRHAGGDGRDAGFVPADAGVDDGRAGGLDGLGQLDHFFKRRATIDQVQHGQAVDDDEVGAHGFAHLAHDLDREAHAVGVGAAVLVGALVGARGDELVDQVALGAHDLDTVVACDLGHLGAVGEVVDGALDLFGGQLARGHRGDRGLDGAGADQAGVVGVATEVQDLQGDLAAGFVHGSCHHLVLLGFFERGQAGATGVGAAVVVGGDAAGHHQGHATAGALGVEGSHALEAVLGFFQANVHGAHQHAVFQRGEAQVQGGKQVRVGAHGGVSLGLFRWVKTSGCQPAWGQLCNQLHECGATLDQSHQLCNWLHG